MEINNIVHFDIFVTDLKFGKKFYEQIFTWEFYEVKGFTESLFFRVIEDNKLAGGELVLKKEIHEGGIHLYINVADIEHTLKTAINAGAKEFHPIKSLPGEFGKYAKFQDPFGNIIGIYQSTTIENTVD